MRTFFATYRTGYTVYVTFEELHKLFQHRRKPVRCGKVFPKFRSAIVRRA